MLVHPRELSARRRVLSSVLLALLSACLLRWTWSQRVFPAAFPAELTLGWALSLQAGLLVLGAAAFAAARGAAAARLGAAYGLILSALGYTASHWPQLARALELSGWIFAGPLLASMLTTALAFSAGVAAFALLTHEARAHARTILFVLCIGWVLPTLATETALTRWWGFGPRSLSEAAGVPTNALARTEGVLWLYASRGRTVQKDAVRMAADGVDLSPQSLVKIEDFLQRTGYRNVFAGEAVSAVRQGWRQWWEADRALDAMALAVPGRVHPDYRAALDLIKAGPLNETRLARLDALAAEAGRSTEGFEDVTQSQYIFEGFSAAYARYGDEANARKWLYRVDNLWPFNEKHIEVTPLEDFRDGRVSGSLQIDGRVAPAVRVGLFMLWVSSGASGSVTTRLLSASGYTDDDGRFAFTELGPGRYFLALMARPELIRGKVLDSPGEFEVGKDAPDVVLPAIRVEREVVAAADSFAPGNLPATPTPFVPERPLLWPRR